MTTTPDEFSLDAKYTLEHGRVYLSGIQALVRLPFDQHRADRARGARASGPSRNHRPEMMHVDHRQAASSTT